MDVFGVIVDDFADAGLTCVKSVVVASVIDYPDIADDEVLDASSAISVNYVVRDEGSGSIRTGSRVASVAEVHDDAVAVAMIG